MLLRAAGRPVRIQLRSLPRGLLRRQDRTSMANTDVVPANGQRGRTAHSAGRGGVVFRYLCLGVGVAGMARLAWNRYGTGDDPDDRLRLAAAAAATAAAAYLAHRYIRVAHCEEPKDELDEALQKVHLAVADAKQDVKKVVDAKMDELWQLAKEKYISEPAKEAFDFIAKICESLRDFGQLDSVEFQTPVIILLALVKKAQDRLDREWLESMPRQTQTSREEFNRHKRLAHFACSIYDASTASSASKRAKLMSVPEADVIMEGLEGEHGSNYVPSFMVLVDHESRSVVLAVRGTFSITDAIIDVICDEEDFLGGQAHRGILRGARSVLERAGGALRAAAEDHTDYVIGITGHSLGAATAELVAMELVSNGPAYLPRRRRVECVALAPPPVFRTNSKKMLEEVSAHIDIYINGQDCVPRTSLASAARLVAALRAVDALPLSKTQLFHLLSHGTDVATHPAAALAGVAAEDPEEVEANLRLLEETVAEAKQERFPFLEHPGRVHYLRPSGSKEEEEASSPLSPSKLLEDPKSILDSRASSRYVVVRQASHVFSRQLTVLERMVLDHLEWCYRKAFERVQFQEAED